MFALEIDFHDGISSPETFLIRRAQALIGSSEFSHVVIDGAAVDSAELRVFRQLGDSLLCYYKSKGAEGKEDLSIRKFKKNAVLELGDVTTTVTSLDLDLLVGPSESLDRAGIRILNEALKNSSPVLPALILMGSTPVIVSFPPRKEVVVGRSRNCLLRVDATDVSSEHARFGFSDDSFWIEDLGSTNGTFLDGERISGRKNFGPEQRIRLGGETVLKGITSMKELEKLESEFKQEDEVDSSLGGYPCIVSESDLVKPKRLVLVQGKTIRMGRDPVNDIWIGASHISRHHCEVQFTEEGELFIKDTSSNGSFLNDTKLQRDQAVALDSGPGKLSFGPEIVLRLCLNEDQESGLSTGTKKGRTIDSSPEFNVGEETKTRNPAILSEDAGRRGIDSKDKSSSSLPARVQSHSDSNPSKGLGIGGTGRSTEKTIYGDSEQDPAFLGKYQGGGLGKGAYLAAFTVLLSSILGLTYLIISKIF